jgi:hypothetical protein
MQTLGSEALDKLFSLGIDTELDIVEEAEQKKEFKIDNDDLAEWALTKIKAEKEDMERLVAICEKKIEEYEEKIRLFKQQYENSSSFLKSHLNQYFQTVPHKKTKTQETYKLPSGTLKLKFKGPEYVRDDEKLVKWLKDNGHKGLVKVKESADWAGLKGQVTVKGENVLSPEGEIIDGVTAVARPPEFIVEV